MSESKAGRAGWEGGREESKGTGIRKGRRERRGFKRVRQDCVKRQERMEGGERREV